MANLTNTSFIVNSTQSNSFPTHFGSANDFEKTEMVVFFPEYKFCLGFIKEASENLCHYDRQNFFYVLLSVTNILGLCNNIMTISLFSQKKYSDSLIGFLIKLIYVNNVLFTAMFIIDVHINLRYPTESKFEDIIKGWATIPYKIAMYMSTGIRGYIEVLRFLDIYKPDISSGTVSSYIVSLVIMSVIFLMAVLTHARMVFFHVSVEDPLDLLSLSVYIFIVAVIIVVSNLARIVVVRKRFSTRSSDISSTIDDHGLAVESLFEFASWSSIFYLLTVLPPIAFIALPIKAPVTKNCFDCRRMVENADYAAGFMYWHLLWDNAIFFYFSQDYRQDVIKTFKRVMCPFMLPDDVSVSF